MLVVGLLDRERAENVDLEAHDESCQLHDSRFGRRGCYGVICWSYAQPRAFVESSCKPAWNPESTYRVGSCLVDGRDGPDRIKSGLVSF